MIERDNINKYEEEDDSSSEPFLPNMNEDYPVFISFSDKDWDIVKKQILQVLNKEGIECFAYKKENYAGSRYKREIMDVTMAEDVSEEEFLTRMNQAMPPEMQLSEARAVDQKHPALMASLRAAEYDLLIREKDTADKLVGAISAMMERDTVLATRKTKTAVRECDIKPLIYTLKGEGQHIYATLVLTEKEACKPGMLIEALAKEAGIDGEIRVLITRTGLMGMNGNGNLVPLETL